MIAEVSEITQICNKCGTDLPLANFYKDSRYTGGYIKICKSCIRDRKKKEKPRSVHNLMDQSKYPLYHHWVTNQKKFNIYSTLPISVGDIILFGKFSGAVKAIRSRRDSNRKGIMFYDEIQLI